MVLMVRDIMTVGVPTCSPETPIIELIEVMVKKSLEAIVVQNIESHAIGYISKDVLIKVYTAGNYETQKAEDVMIHDLPQLPPDIPITTAAQMMIDMNVRVVYMTHRAGGIEYPAAQLTYDHIIAHMANKDGEPPSTVGIQAERKSPIDLFIERRDAAIEKNRPKNKQGE